MFGFGFRFGFDFRFTFGFGFVAGCIAAIAADDSVVAVAGRSSKVVHPYTVPYLGAIDGVGVPVNDARTAVVPGA